jgi:hypothetical protein
LTENELVIPFKDQPLQGSYFWRVISEDSEGHTQRSFEKYADEQNIVYYGVQPLIIGGTEDKS